MKKLPLVVVEGLDHTINTEGPLAEPYSMKVAGWLAKETKSGYYLITWMFGGPEDEHNVTVFIAKTVGMKIRRLR